MEIIITSITVTALLGLIVLIGTGGRPMIFFTSTGEVFSTLAKNGVPLFWSLTCVALVGGFLYFFYMSPATNIGPEQPIPFSHRLHAGVKSIDCDFCHPYTGRSIHPGLPPVEKCLYCHNYIIAKHPEILKEHKYFETKTPTPWKKAFYLPEHVLFNHQRHIKKKIECNECHGPIETMDRIKGERFKMGFCIDCHKIKGASIGCWIACHK